MAAVEAQAGPGSQTKPESLRRAETAWNAVLTHACLHPEF